MHNCRSVDYSALDTPEVLQSLFHPRPETAYAQGSKPGQEIMIPVAQDAAVGARFHVQDRRYPNILFFHGNGEIVADYDELGPMFNQLMINFLAVDYRGYGRSSGEPSVSAMMTDCHTLFYFVRDWLNSNGYDGRLIVMGRSLGSASALELAACHPEDLDALVIESGFALAGPLLRLLGVDVETLGYREEKGFGNIHKIRKFEKPTLVIHAENDHIIPFSDGQALYDASPAPGKTLLKIPGANHNDIFMKGITEYLTALVNLVNSLGE